MKEKRKRYSFFIAKLYLHLFDFVWPLFMLKANLQQYSPWTSFLFSKILLPKRDNEKFPVFASETGRLILMCDCDVTCHLQNTRKRELDILLQCNYSSVHWIKQATMDTPQSVEHVMSLNYSWKVQIILTMSSS